jgi:hypothetical protein
MHATWCCGHPIGVKLLRCSAVPSCSLLSCPALPCLLQVGISAPQGCGKTTLVEQLQQLLSANGLAAASVSIDDFYLTYQVEQMLHVELWRPPGEGAFEDKKASQV